MLCFITGASGSGKTACIDHLRVALPGASVHDFDAIGVPQHPDSIWRQQSTERWLCRYKEHSGSTELFCICGQVVLGEILACPTADQINKICLCMLDVSDQERILRLERHNYSCSQDMLNWAAWLRMHHHNPCWAPYVIKDNAWKELDFSRWTHLKDWSNFANIAAIDTTYLTAKEVAESIVYWLKPMLQYPSDAPTRIFREATQEDLTELIALLKDDQLGRTREDSTDLTCYEKAFKAILTDSNHLILVIASNEELLGCVQVSYLPNLTFKGTRRAQLEGVRVKEKYRGQGLGRQLIKEAIALASSRGCRIVQLTTNKTRPEAIAFYKSLSFKDTHAGMKLYLDT